MTCYCDEESLYNTITLLATVLVGWIMFTVNLHISSIKVKGRTCHNFPKWGSLISTNLQFFVQNFHKMTGEMNRVMNVSIQTWVSAGLKVSWLSFNFNEAQLTHFCHKEQLAVRSLL